MKTSAAILCVVILCGVSDFNGASAAAPFIDWASQPVGSNESVLLLGGPFAKGSKVTLAAVTAPSSVTQKEYTLPPYQPSRGSLKFIVPAELPQAQWTVVVDGSNAYTLNAPQPWWVSGDLRQHATPGGYIRVFGSCVHFTSDGAKLAKKQLAEANAALREALDTSIGEILPLVHTVEAAQQMHHAASAASASVLRLTAKTGTAMAQIVLQSDPQNSTAWAAWFTLPSSITPGDYTIEVANHLSPDNFVALGAFGSYVSSTQPNVTTITILSAEEEGVRQPWKARGAKIFKVSDYGPYGLPGCGSEFNNLTCPINNATGKQYSPDLYWTNASVAIEKALAAAGAAGGGTVYFPRGTYFVNSSHGFDVPWGVKLQGEGKDLVEIIFSETYGVCAEQSCPTKPGSPGSGALALFRGPDIGTGGWAVSDLTLYVTAFHNTMFYVSNRTVGFEMQRVRATANSFFGGNGPNKGRSPQANVSWTLGDTGDLLVMLGTNYLVEDSDLYCDGTVITSTSRPGYCVVQVGSKMGAHHCHGSAWGEIRNNRLYNGHASHFMSQWKQIIFENNTVTGISPIAGGQSLGTGPGGGRAHHVYHAKNKIQFVWGNDREIVTFDDAGSAYLGRIASVSADGTTLTLASDARSSNSGEWLGWDGAAVSVLNGTGRGTWRRVVKSGIDATAHAGEFFNPNNRTWLIDRPFGVSVTEGQVVSITPARSRIIFEHDHFLDGGTLQFYGQAQECVVESMRGERMAGFVAWGQWRGWYQAPCGTMGMPPCPPHPPTASVPVARSAGSLNEVKGGVTGSVIVSSPSYQTPGTSTWLGGEMGNGIMMNTQLSYLNNQIMEGNKIVRWSAMGGGSYSPGFRKFYNGATFAIQAVNIRIQTGGACKQEPGGICHDWTDLAATSAVIFRGNIAHSNGGFQIASAAFTTSVRDVIIESNVVLQSDPEKAMQISPRMLSPSNGTVLVRSNVVPM
jgi:hypothetical protein